MANRRVSKLVVLDVLVVLCLVAQQSVTAPFAVAGTDKEAKEAFQKGDFYQAIGILSAKLREKPDHQDNIALMEQCLPLFFDQAKRSADKAALRKDWDSASKEYSRVIEIGDLLTSIPPVPKKVEGKKEKVPTSFSLPGNVDEQFRQARDQAIDTHYAKGQAAEAESKFKDAAVEYRLARDYDANYKDVATRYQDCRQKAMLKIAVMPFEDLTNSKYGALGDLLTQQVIAEAMHANPEFLQFVTRDYLDQMAADKADTKGSVINTSNAAKFGKELGVHAFVFGKLMSIVDNYPPDGESPGTNEVTEYSKKGDIVHRCAYVVHIRQGSVKVLGSFQVIDGGSGIIKTSSNLDKTASDATSWVTFRGEEDAIPPEIRDRNLGERPIAPAGELATRGINQLGTELAANLVETFR